ncbi:MAG: TolC family protein [Alphaproteobacteria bacterium]|nr:TolC family protein [Alphaproteobacteria bacterium]
MLKLSKIGAVLFLASCSVGPDYERPMFWSNQNLIDSLGVDYYSNYPISIFWYRDFKDKTLNRLIDEALQNSPNVKIALAKLRQARYSLNINEVQYLPMIDANSEYNYAYAPKYEELGDKTSYFRLGLDASWELDIWGGGRRKTESSQALYKAAANNLTDVLISLTAEVANNYILLRTTQERLRISKQNLYLQQEILNTVKNKFDAGLADNTALNQAKYAVQTTQSLLPDLEYQEESYKNAIAILLGKLPGDIKELNDVSNNMVSKIFVFDVKQLRGFPIEVIRNRPDVKMAENMLISKNADIGQAVANMFPNVNITATLGWQAHLFRDLGSSENAAYGYTPAINLPFLHWGQLVNQVKLSKSVKEEYLYLYQNTLLEAIQEIRNSIVGIDKSYNKVRSLNESAKNMQKVFDDMKIKYREGLVEFSDFLSTEQNLLEAQNNLITAKGAVYQNIISFYKSIGGGY